MHGMKILYKEYNHNKKSLTQLIMAHLLPLLIALMIIKKHNAIAMPATIFSGLSLATLAIAANHYNTEISQLGIISAGLLASFFMGNYIKNIYTTLIKYSIVSFLSKSHYKPIS